MRFKKIEIENCFTYAGNVVYHFSPSDRPITLIIGENGFGKTSFINSVKIALHGIGKDLLHIGAQRLTKQDFILGNPEKHFSGILNRNARANGHNEAKITIELEDDESWLIERRYTIHSSSYAETLLLFDADGNLFAENDEAQDFINSKISPTMAQFFFFDGEKIQTIADFSHEEFTKMLEDVLELDIYDQTIKDAQELIRRTIKKDLSGEVKQQVALIEKELEETEEKIETLKHSLTFEKQQLKDLESSYKALESKLHRLKSRYAKSLQNAKSKLETLLDQKDTLLSEFKTATLVQLPLLLNDKLFYRVKNDIEENYAGRINIDPDLLKRKKEELLAKIPDIAHQVSKVFDEVFQSHNENQSVSFADPHHVEKQFAALPSINLKKLLAVLSQNKLEIEETQSEIEELQNKIANDRKDYEEEFDRLKNLLEKVGHQKGVCESKENEIVELEHIKKRLKSDLARLTIHEHKTAITEKKIETLQAIIRVAEEMKKKIKKQKRQALEASINEKFHYLKKEGYEADKIVLDDHFKINIYDKFGQPMDILSSSSGQKQIIATALIWGISEYIGEEIPMIIDTPLGRLDDKNQTLILKEFYPHASKQVIILPTPSELKHEGFKALENEINEVFVLSNAGSATAIKKRASLREYFQHYQPPPPFIEESA
jgi:DNA sulfur modification protein DndD